MDGNVLMEIKAPSGWAMRLCEYQENYHTTREAHMARAARACKTFMALEKKGVGHGKVNQGNRTVAR